MEKLFGTIGAGLASLTHTDLIMIGLVVAVFVGAGLVIWLNPWGCMNRDEDHQPGDW